ncbi:MAG: type II toxin-antitoxin system VapC family toxin [Chloroflexota bacterium]
MRYLLDTTVLIDHAKGRPRVAELLASLFAETGDLYTCDVVVAEALSGGDEIQRASIMALIRALEYVSTHPDAAAWAGDSRRRRRASGPRSLADSIIAGIAAHMDAIVVTRNPKDFEVQGVRVLGYG